MNEGAVEKIGRRLIRRTGWATEMRRCPLHGSALELCFDETEYRSWSRGRREHFDHDDNRVRWRCAHCQGSFLENYFLQTPPLTSSREAISLSCPRCSGTRVTHDCVAICCGRHHCIDCGSELELFVDVLELEARLFRHWRLDFERDANPGAACPHCREQSMVMSNLKAEHDVAFCKACGSKLRLRLELRGGK